MLSILVKGPILDSWLGPEQTSADGYNTVLKILREMCKDARQVMMM